MSDPILSHLDVTNFRSIRGRIFAPLNARVVLIHGENGAGKTSLLSAIELALTGSVQALRRADPAYAGQLLHRGARSGSVAVQTSDAPMHPYQSDVTGTGVVKGQLLEEAALNFFTERAYLPQSHLGQLLQIYQESGSGLDSPLARFVGNLLGLDRLDALEAGLQPLGDVRNMRKSIDGWSDAEAEKKHLEGILSEQRSRRQQAAAVFDRALGVMQQTVLALGSPIPITTSKLNEVSNIVGGDGDDILTNIARRRRELSAIVSEFSNASNATSAADESVLAQALALAAERLSAWRSTHGGQMAGLAQKASVLLSSALPTEYDMFVQTAITFLEPEHIQVTSRLTTANADALRRVEANSELVAAVDRLSAIDAEMAPFARNSEVLAAALAEFAPFIDQSDHCPVCDRDFVETKAGSLSVHVHEKIRRLSGTAERLLTLGRVRGETVREIGFLNEEIEALQARMPTPETFARLQHQATQIEVLLAELRAFHETAVTGADLSRAEMAARRALTGEQARDRVRLAARDTLSDFALAIGEPIPADGETVEAAAERLAAVLGGQERVANERVSLRLQAQAALKEAVSARDNLLLVDRSVDDSQTRLSRADAALQRGQRLREQGQQIRSLVDTVRSGIIRREFNDRLNKLWRDLFIRLAPDEPFVPAFRVPASDTRGLQPRLITEHRDGGDAGGTPGAMLSSGNLNTAALTLFIALHLSVPTKFPCLILDDPVQSMDDIHIAHFAALLRTLAKEHDRQIIIAVHDRQLFDYLRLELSPAYPNDSLLTLELSRGSRRDTTCMPQRYQFQEESGLFVAA